MKTNPEPITQRLKRVEAMCICEGCPTYIKLGETDDYIAYCFPTRGKSKKIKEEDSCICPSCLIWAEMNFTKDFSAPAAQRSNRKGPSLFDFDGLRA